MPIEVIEVKASDTIDTGRQVWNANDDTLADAANSLTDQQEAHVTEGHPDIYYSKSETDSVLSDFLAGIVNALLGVGTVLAGMIKGSGANKAVDGTSIGLNGSDELEVKDLGISTAKIAANAVTTEKLEHKEWIGLISQNGTNPPVITEIKNTFGGGLTFTPARVSAGTYTITVASPIFSQNKCPCMISPSVAGSAAIYYNTTTSFIIYTSDGNTLAPLDSVLPGNTVIIRLYPA